MEDYKEKYENALSQAKQAIDNIPDKPLAEWLQSIFPELKESEDERIKRCIGMCLTDVSEQRFEELNTTLKDCLAWLEKQGIQELNNEVATKFKAGDWIISNDNARLLRHIIAVDVSGYGYTTDCGYYEHNYYDNNFHLWTIQDAKDGDILTTRLSPEGGWICIFKERTEESFTTHCFLSSDSEFVLNINTCKQHGTLGLHPATKEQRDLLFQKIKKAGYEWDADKKELKKIEQKLTWSEEDERLLSKLQTYVDMESFDRECNGEDLIDWLKSLKPQPKRKWSEEDEKLLKLSLENLTELKNSFGEKYGKVGDCINWIQSLKDRMKGE